MATRSTKEQEKLKDAYTKGKLTRDYLNQHMPKVDSRDLFFLILEGQAQILAQQESMLVSQSAMMAQIATVTALQSEVEHLKGCVTELEAKVAAQEEASQQSQSEMAAQLELQTSQLDQQNAQIDQQATEIYSQDDQILRLEAYSGRSTLILAGLSEESGEEPAHCLIDKTVEVLKTVAPELSSFHISTLHRNGRRVQGKKRTVTVVFTHVHFKDLVMKSEKRKELRDKKKVRVFHRISPALLKRKEELAEHEDVKWVYYAGHRMFTVCKKDDSVVHNIIRLRDLESE